MADHTANGQDSPEEPELTQEQLAQLYHQQHVRPNAVAASYFFSPVPMQNGETAISFRIDTPTGMFITFWSPQSCHTLGVHAITTAEPHMSGLTIARKNPLWKPGDPD